MNPSSYGHLVEIGYEATDVVYWDIGGLEPGLTKFQKGLSCHSVGVCVGRKRFGIITAIR